jgi:coatomer subunit beta
VPLPLQVSSTETGVIFGNIVYEGSGYAERSVVVLNDIHIDIMDYISPAVCADVQFRNMWAEFEWENKVRGVLEALMVDARRPAMFVA